MRTPDFIGSVDNLITVFVMMLIVSELLIGKIGCYIEERIGFDDVFGELLH